MNNWIVVTVIALIFQMTAIYSASIDQYCAPKGATDSTVIFHNNCAVPVSVYMVAGNYGATQGAPACLKNLSAKTGVSTVYLSPPGTPAWGYAFYQAGPSSNPGCSSRISCPKTRFEITIQSASYASWDVSANDGWDMGMTVTTPANTAGPVLLVATDVNAPGIYPAVSPYNPCAVQPCASNAWDNNQSNQGPYHVYLCNRPQDVTYKNSPGKCGCKQCPGITCTPGSLNCTTSGGGVYCKTVCPSKTAICASVNWVSPPPQCTKLCS